MRDTLSKENLIKRSLLNSSSNKTGGERTFRKKIIGIHTLNQAMLPILDLQVRRTTSVRLGAVLETVQYVFHG